MVLTRRENADMNDNMVRHDDDINPPPILILSRAAHDEYFNAAIALRQIQVRQSHSAMLYYSFQYH